MKVVLITGASGGIGLAMTRAFIEEGYKVYAHYYKSDRELKDLSRTERHLTLVQADLMTESGVNQLFDQISESINVLINNAAVAEFSLFDKISGPQWDRVLSLNLRSYFLCAQKAFPTMVHKKAGSIINISSIWGQTGASMEVHYSAAKAGVIGLTKALAKELAPSDILVNAIAPGVIDTAMLDDLDDEARDLLKEEIPLGRFGQPREVAELAVYLARQTYITGQVISINGGLLI